MQSSRKRDRSVDVLDMPGEFPSRQKVNRVHQRMEATIQNNSSSTGLWLLSYLLTPLKAAKGWLIGGVEQQIQEAPATTSHAKRSRKHTEHRSARQQHRRHRRRKHVGGGRYVVDHRKSLFGKSVSTGESTRKSRNSSLVREYTLPAYNYRRMQTEYTPADNYNDYDDDNCDDTTSVLTIDSRMTENWRGRQFSFAGSDITTTTTTISSPFVTPGKPPTRKSRTAKVGADDWISQLRRKIQETLAVSAPSSAHVLTPAYDRVCKEQSDFDARLEKARQEMAFRLPPDAQMVIKKAKASGFAAEINNVPVSAHDIATLGDGEWLNDEVINFYMQLLITRSEKQNPVLPKVHAFNTFFFSTLQKGGYVRVRRWTRRVPLFEKDMVIVPVHLGVHWCCAVIDFRRKTIKYYDALHGNNSEALELLMDYLREESRDKLKADFDDSGWTVWCDKDIPRQLNGYDCGVFAITFAEYTARDAPFAFSQTNCPFLRKKVTYEIATKSLISTLV